MKLLILGGTQFAGRHLVEAALARNDQVTLFNRGQTNPELFPNVEKLRGDRDGDLSALKGRRWDVVVDTSGYVPRVVRASAELLAGSVGHYTFISTISVYSEVGQADLDEEAPVGTLDDETVEAVDNETYGPLKALCERVVQEVMPGRALVVRPGLIVGPYDPTDRFTYWPNRVARGGEVLAPGDPRVKVQFIDARDLAVWILAMAEVGEAGVFNATGPGEPLTMGELLATCERVTGAAVQFSWVPDSFLLAHQVQPWTELPLWLPQEDFMDWGSIDIRKAVNRGLTFRPLTRTVKDVLAWETSRPEGYEWRAGLAAEKEKELLAAWHAQNSS